MNFLTLNPKLKRVNKPMLRRRLTFAAVGLGDSFRSLFGDSPLDGMARFA
jgi:hypothetical protein